MCTNSSPLEKAVQFHGHICPGLLMGLRAAEFARSFLGVEADFDEELVAIVENDACGVDAIQAVLGCTFGKGNLIFRDWGKQVYTIASRKDKRAVRISSKTGARKGPDYDRFRELSRQEILTSEEEDEKETLRGVLFEDIMTRPFETLFDYREVPFEVPSRARIYPTVICATCQEGVMEPRAVKTGAGWLCPACLKEGEV